ncbi:uncharacterized protein KZ484_015772 isoform 2-T2 [Pholidichthys leucotaenia]
METTTTETRKKQEDMRYLTDSSGMSRSDILRGIITEKLNTAAREILAVVERTVADYEEEASDFRQEIDRQRRQLELLQPQVKLERRVDFPLFSLFEAGGRCHHPQEKDDLQKCEPNDCPVLSLSEAARRQKPEEHSNHEQDTSFTPLSPFIKDDQQQVSPHQPEDQEEQTGCELKVDTCRSLRFLANSEQQMEEEKHGDEEAKEKSFTEADHEAALRFSPTVECDMIRAAQLWINESQGVELKEKPAAPEEAEGDDGKSDASVRLQDSEEQISNEELPSDEDHELESESQPQSSGENVLEPIKEKNVHVSDAKSFSDNLKSRESEVLGALDEPRTRPRRSRRGGKRIRLSDTQDKDWKNYCYICGQPQSKLARHLKIHATENTDIAHVFALPKNSKERKKMLTRLRNRGNYNHNTSVLTSGTGMLKFKRKPKKKYDPKECVHCVYCRGLFIRHDLWRHIRNCQLRQDDTGPVRHRVLSLATMKWGPISHGVRKLLSRMRKDLISTTVCSDNCILQLAQFFYNKHGGDPAKHDYIRMKVREVGRLLLVLRRDFSIYSLEEAMSPVNFHMAIQAIKKMAGFDGEMNCYRLPSVALKLGYSLQKICDIIHIKALLMSDNKKRMPNRTLEKTSLDSLLTVNNESLAPHQTFEDLSPESLQVVDDDRVKPRQTLEELSKLIRENLTKSSILRFTEDMQRLHRHLEKVAGFAFDNLKKAPTVKSYEELCRVTLTKVVLLNRRRGGVVSNMRLKDFAERKTVALRRKIPVGLTEFERKLCQHFSRVEVSRRSGQKVSLLLPPDMVEVLTLLVSWRKYCSVPEESDFVFARPNESTQYNALESLRLYAKQCGAQNPKFLWLPRLSNYAACLSQLLNLKNSQMEVVGNFLGCNIDVQREYDETPEATTQLAKILKLLLESEKGTAENLRGKTLKEVDIEERTFHLHQTLPTAATGDKSIRRGTHKGEALTED